MEQEPEENNLSNLNTDVLGEIFKYLDVASLLHLSFSSSFFRLKISPKLSKYSHSDYVRSLGAYSLDLVLDLSSSTLSLSDFHSLVIGIFENGNCDLFEALISPKVICDLKFVSTLPLVSQWSAFPAVISAQPYVSLLHAYHLFGLKPYAYHLFGLKPFPQLRFLSWLISKADPEPNILMSIFVGCIMSKDEDAVRWGCGFSKINLVLDRNDYMPALTDIGDKSVSDRFLAVILSAADNSPEIQTSYDVYYRYKSFWATPPIPSPYFSSLSFIKPNDKIEEKLGLMQIFPQGLKHETELYRGYRTYILSKIIKEPSEDEILTFKILTELFWNHGVQLRSIFADLYNFSWAPRITPPLRHPIINLYCSIVGLRATVIRHSFDGLCSQLLRVIVFNWDYVSPTAEETFIALGQSTETVISLFIEKSPNAPKPLWNESLRSFLVRILSETFASTVLETLDFIEVAWHLILPKDHIHAMNYILAYCFSVSQEVIQSYFNPYISPPRLLLMLMRPWVLKRFPIKDLCQGKANFIHRIIYRQPNIELVGYLMSLGVSFSKKFYLRIDELYGHSDGARKLAFLEIRKLIELIYPHFRHPK
jgi:hypothetical protein